MLRRFAFILSIAAAMPAAAQGCPELAEAHTVESERYVLSYRTKPETVAVGQHFAVEMAVCPRAGLPAPESVQVDGFMPDHNHGMNYKAVVKPAGDGRYAAAGLMFHMPGRWDFIFEVRGGGKTDRMTSTVMLQ
jgi:YtkA-like